MKRWGPLAAAVGLVLLVGATTTPTQLWYTATNGVQRRFFSKMADECSVNDYGVTGTSDDSSVFNLARANCKKIRIPAGSYNIGTTTVTLATGTAFMGDSIEGTVINYSGTGCALTADSASGWKIEGMTINATGNNAGKRAICLGNTTGPNKRGTIRDVFVQGDAAFPQIGYGIYANATTLNSLYWTQIEHVSANYFDVSYRLEGCTVASCGGTGNGPNATFFTDINSTAANTGVQALTNVADVDVKSIHCQASGLASATDLCRRGRRRHRRHEFPGDRADVRPGRERQALRDQRPRVRDVHHFRQREQRRRHRQRHELPHLRHDLQLLREHLP
jgi:hypothetical protein